MKKSGSKLSCSIGAAVYPADGSTYEQLFLKADMALYAGKNWGKGAVWFTIHLSLRTAENTYREDLRTAL